MLKKQDVPLAATCASCRWGKNAIGQCRKRAPEAELRAHGWLVARWPDVNPHVDVCGDWEED